MDIPVRLFKLHDGFYSRFNVRATAQLEEGVPDTPTPATNTTSVASTAAYT
jgi:hypothetical protein